MTSVKTSSPVVITAAFLLALASIGVITKLQDRAGSSHQTEDVLDDVQREFVALQTIPYDGIGAEKNTAARALVLQRMQTSERRIEATLAELQNEEASPHLQAALTPYRSNTSTLEQIRVAIAEGRGDAADPLGPVAGRSQRAFDKSMDAARAEYQRRALASLWLARFGSAGAILALVALFGIFYVRLRKANRRARRLADENSRLSLNESQHQVIERLALAAEYRDDVTGQHTRRVGDLSVRIGVALGLPKGQLLLLGQAAPLHDVGKIAIPDSILLKPGPLTHAEFEQMKSHTTLGAAMLAGRDFPLLEMAEQIALSHHERWDGHGYPGGRSGLGIPSSDASSRSPTSSTPSLTRAPTRTPGAWPTPCSRSRARADGSSTRRSSTRSCARNRLTLPRAAARVRVLHTSEGERC
jgi:HD-GYP domain-containing protein (c-di-GMP phosphodiesterase class II)